MRSWRCASLLARDETFPRGMRDELESVYVPLADWVDRRRAARTAPFLLGIAGAPGTGKSSLARLLEALLTRERGLRVFVLSLDDLYLTRAERERIARSVHPLLRTRGVPGTHDVALGRRVLTELLTAGEASVVCVPRFDKAIDDRVAGSMWSRWEGPVDVVIFEGWCLGARPEPLPALLSPVNELESEEDGDGSFRRYVNQELASSYQSLFAMVNALVFLAAPDLESVLAWRREQERSLRVERSAPGTKVMSCREIGRFVQFFERVTRAMLSEVPERADVVVYLAADHRSKSVVYRT